MLAGFGFGVGVFAHVVVRALSDAALRARLWREVLAQVAVTSACAVLFAIGIERMPMVRLGKDLLPRFVWEKNPATVALIAAFFIEWIVAALWPRTHETADLMRARAGVRSAAPRSSITAEVVHRARTLAPLLAVSLAWTVALLWAAWVGLHALAPRASDPARLLITSLVAAFLVLLPALPLLGTWVWFIADRAARARDPTLRARDLLERHPGEVLGLAACALPGALPLTHLLWRPFIDAAVALLRSSRVDADATLPDGLKPDPIDDAGAQLKLGAALIRKGTTAAPPREGRLLKLLWAPALVVAAARAALTDAEQGGRARRTLALQVAAFVAIGALWLALFGFEIEDQEHRFGSATIRVGFGASFVAALFSLLHLSEAIVIALSREHHDAISARASVLVGVPPDEDVPDPRVRLDRGWLWRRFKRRAQGGVILVVSALPWVIVAFLLTLPVVKLLEDAVLVGWFLRVAVGAVGNAVLLCFALYWGAVFLVGKTSHAWTIETTREPFFLESLARVAARFPPLAWPVSLYLWLVRRTLGVVPRPAALMEQMPMEAIGLALVRVSCLIPGVYLVLRPFLPVGAALLLKHRAPEALVALAPQAADAPDPTSGHAA